jgi:hypothetical protein
MDISESFVRFWAAYPKKKSKGDAWKAWRQVEALRPDIDTLLAVLEKAKRSTQWRKDSGEFIPYPATWLRAWGWDDEYEQAPVAQAHKEWRPEQHKPADPELARQHLSMIRGSR